MIPHQRPGAMASVPTGGPRPPSAAPTPAAAAPPPAAARPAAAVLAAATPSIDLSSEGSKDNAGDRLAGFPSPTTTHMKVNVGATFVQKMPPVWACITKFSPAVASGPNQGNNVKCCLASRRLQGLPSVPPQRHQGLDQTFHKDHEAKWKLVLGASSRSVKAKSARSGGRRGIR